MPHSHVHLPPGDLIDTFLLTRQIARAVRPNLRHARGIDCVIGKLVALPDQPFGSRGDLTDAERQEMSKFLALLPPLHGAMSDQERLAFWDAFDQLSERPSWRPQLPAIEEIQSSAFANAEIQERHLKALGEEIQSGRIIAIDRQHIQVLVIGAGISIQRSDAVKYLQARGLSDAEEVVHIAPPVALKPQRAAPKAGRPQQPTVPSKPTREAKSSEATAPMSFSKPGHAVEIDTTFAPAFQRQHPKRSTSSAVVESAQQSSREHRPTMILRRRQVEERTALSRSAIYEKLDPASPRHDPTFPKQIKIGTGSVGWLESELDAWLVARASARKL